MPEFKTAQVMERRNKLLMDWVADNLELEAIKRQHFYREMEMILQYTTDNEVAEYLLERLYHKKLITDLEDAKKAMKRFHDMAHEQLSGIPDNKNS
ncbi:MAG: hypothetical protein COV35_00710 [Alphaproteobacteria bacterium CG11_big_fil_rev_8_21_14_0_20_39_49]|nr:MAG: hypothetical protein COV35_00710 [Alphaproteobacteria bacterium CG11_big_fil_rev_8_21_14_0_20_39_49]